MELYTHPTKSIEATCHDNHTTGLVDSMDAVVIILLCIIRNHNWNEVQDNVRDTGPPYNEEGQCKE